MNATKGTKEVSQRRPDTFNRICMDLVKTITVCVSCPLAILMENNLTAALNTVIAAPTIRIHR